MGRVAAGAEAITHALDPDTRDGADVRLASADVGELKMLCALLAELGVQVGDLAQRLPDDDLHGTVDELAEEAASDLREGIIDPDRARLAALILTADMGFPALAEALRSGDTHQQWEHLTVGELLGSFRDATDAATSRVLEAANLSDAAEFATCGADELDRLAVALQEHAPAH